MVNDFINKQTTNALFLVDKVFNVKSEHKAQFTGKKGSVFEISLVVFCVRRGKKSVFTRKFKKKTTHLGNEISYCCLAGS